MNITRTTHQYIRAHPSIADCVDRGLVNYSALAREICKAHGLDSTDAVVMACRRYYERRRPRDAHGDTIADLVRHAKIRLRNKIAVVILEKSSLIDRALAIQKVVRKQRGDFNLIEGEEVITIITNVEFIPMLRESFGGKIRKTTRNVVQISMIFDQRIETTSGVLSYIYRLFAENDINIREEMSCWTDVMVIIDEADATKAMQALNLE